VRERPSEKEAEATLAAGGDLDVGDGHCCHLPPSSQPPADDQPPAEGRVPMGAAAVDNPDNQHSCAHYQQPLSSEQQCSVASPLRADSAARQDSFSGDVASTDAPMQDDAGRW
jgi:hypothetical protein